MRVLYMHTLRDERTGRALQPPRGTSGLLRDAAHDARDRPEPRVVERGGRRRNLGPPRTMPLQSARTWETPRGAPTRRPDPAGRRRERERAFVVRLDGVDGAGRRARTAARRPSVRQVGGASFPPLHLPQPQRRVRGGLRESIVERGSSTQGDAKPFFRPGASERLNAASVSAVRWAGEPVRLMDDLAATMSEEVSRTPSSTK